MKVELSNDESILVGKTLFDCNKFIVKMQGENCCFSIVAKLDLHDYGVLSAIHRLDKAAEFLLSAKKELISESESDLLKYIEREELWSKEPENKKYIKTHKKNIANYKSLLTKLRSKKKLVKN